MKEFKYKINDTEYKVTINSIEENKAKLEVNGTPYEVDIVSEKKAPAKPIVKRSTATPVSSPSAAPAPAKAGGSVIKAPLPGVILDIVVKVGDEVKRGQKVAVLEAMKMENNINATHDGKVLEIKVAKGDSILEGSDIVIIG